jgi:hypothetical protein
MAVGFDGRVSVHHSNAIGASHEHDFIDRAPKEASDRFDRSAQVEKHDIRVLSQLTQFAYEAVLRSRRPNRRGLHSPATW